MEQMRTRLNDHTFETIQEEIVFFRRVKPQAQSKLIYYLLLYQLEARRPSGSQLVQEKYLQDELQKVGKYFGVHQNFLQYINSGADFLDEQYFVRNKQRVLLHSNPHVHSFDPDFNTSHDFLVAELTAYEQLGTYLTRELDHLKGNPTPAIKPTKVQRKRVQFARANINAAEVVYALWVVKAFGDATLKQVTESCEEAWGIRLPHINHNFIEIRNRKKIRAAYLTKMIDALNAHAEELDDRL